MELLSKVDRNDAKILLDGSGGKKYEKNLLTRLRKELGDISKKNFRLTDSIKSDGIQLADLVAGSVNGALLKRKDATSCMRLIQKRIKTTPTPEHH